LQVPLADLGRAFSNVRFLGALLSANFLVVPLLVTFLVQFLPPDPIVRLGVLLVRDLMIESVEHRFGIVDQLPHAVEWLSDNGSCYTARETITFAQDRGFITCFTPITGPESNGMAEAFVKTFKRDYVYIHDRPDAKTVMAQLDQWFEDYNEYHPHKGLKMKSPRQFIRSQLLAESCPV
jgi:transposase InsO family protein